MSVVKRCIATTERVADTETGRPRGASDVVTVLGAGIGGLTAAIACARAGHSIEIIEQAPALTEVGAGLQLAPNGMRVLRALGVEVPGIDNRAVHLIDGATGRSLVRMPLGPGFRLVHRADLIAALAAHLDGVTLHLNTEVAGLEDRGLRLADGRLWPAGRVIGADGVRGAARRYVSPDHAARFTGQVAWRATVPVETWPAEAQVHVGAGRHLVLYPLRDGRLLNIVAVEERADWTADGWSRTDDPENLRRAFDGYAAPVRALLDRVETVNLWGLMDHGVTPDWTRGGCTVIGDAAHPTLPFLAQGANLALEDAWLVSRMLEDPTGYEALRRARVTRALAAAAGNARAYHLRGLSRHVAHAGLRLAGAVAPGALLRRYDWLYGHDVTAQ
ncbi:FAD-dependent monooxygenase [Jannaschia sp. M317]|uniref:FAD-dependent monooxygenase n=1 Tax=Jannaschia sp. M317 TaxID=2867011 RepID=UPI0021A52987|nr:FAD-dependent monooxygenase [Jannaschia sp. M317]UWQ19348.1 FAD-dependent monooxygenase [Jannaschia sp. M317]